MDDLEFVGKVFVPSNLKKNKQTVIFKFSFRDLIYLAIILVIAIPIYLILKNIDPTIAINLALIPSTFIAFIAFKKWDNMYFEEYIFYKYSNQVKSKPKRINSSDNIYEMLENKKTIVNNNSSIEKPLYTGIETIDTIIYEIIKFAKTKNSSKKIVNKQKLNKTLDIISKEKSKIKKAKTKTKSKYIKYT